VAHTPSVAVGHVDVTAELDELFDDVTAMTADGVLDGCQRRLTTHVTFQHLHQYQYQLSQQNVGQCPT